MMVRALMVALMLAGVSVDSQASAASVNIVSMGASFTFGTGRGANYGTGVTNPAETYPAQLEALLRQKGLDVSVKNAGVPGDTTEQIFERLDLAVADGTQLVTLEPSYGNDKREGLDTKRAIAEILSRLRERHIPCIVLDRSLTEAIWNNPAYMNGSHPNAVGHGLMARSLYPRVLAALKKP